MCHSALSFVFVATFALSCIQVRLHNSIALGGVQVPAILLDSPSLEKLKGKHNIKRDGDADSKKRTQEDNKSPRAIDNTPWYYERGRKIEGLERRSLRRRQKETDYQTNLFRYLLVKPQMEDYRAVVGSSNFTLGAGAPSQQWVMADPMTTPRRNHGCLIIKPNENDALSNYAADNDDDEIMMTILGRYGRSVHLWNLKTGRQTDIVTNGTDPAGFPLNDLNHVSTVLVNKIDDTDGASREIWLPCGFHGDKVNTEISSSYVRIVDLRVMKVKLGPKLPFSGGACAALTIHVDGPDRPPHICTFGGSVDHHDSGVFIDKVSCYDRVRQRWAHPFGKLPTGMDHLNAALVPKGLCHPSDPAKIFLLNYRTMAYAGQSEEILAFDLPEGGWSENELEESALDPDVSGNWYLFAKPNATGGSRERESINYGRDASGLVTADGGKVLLNFGGTHSKPLKTYREVRAFDVCQQGLASEKSWSEVGSIGLSMYAIQTCASSSRQIAVSCGGTGPAIFGLRKGKKATNADNSNSPFCTVNRFRDHVLDDLYQ